MALTAKRVGERMRAFTPDGREAKGRGIAEYRIYDLPAPPGLTGWVGTAYATSAKKAIAYYRQNRQGKTD